jgi:hypothetical protein
MKVHSRVAVVALALNLLVPTATLAQEGAENTNQVQATASPSPTPKVDTRSAEAKAQAAAKFCTNATKIRQNITDESKGKNDSLKANFEERSSKIAAKRIEITAKVSANRLKADQQRTRRFAELEAKATTDEQKAAVKAYEESVLAAIAKHRAAVDAADKIFMDGVMSAVAERQTQLQVASATYTASVAAAVNQAKVSCAAGTKPATVRQTMTTALKNAQDKFRESQKSLSKATPNLNPLKAAHRAAIKQANADFRAELNAAVAKLKVVLGGASPKASASPSTSPSPSVSPAL